MKKYLKLMRVKHWIKNLLILFPLVFNREISNLTLLKESFIGVILFSLLSSVIYIFNDICDVEKDRLHPIKQSRPLAANLISLKKAKILCVGLGLILIVACFFRHNIWDLLLVVYALLNIGYSKGLKNVALMDVIILVAGYLLRVLYGGGLTNIQISHWMFLTVLSTAGFLCFGKRRNEIRKGGGTGRKVLQSYSYDYLDRCMLLLLALTIVFYALSCIDNMTVPAQAGIDLSWTVPLVLVICLRYIYTLDKEECEGDPVEVIYKDKLLFFLILIYVVIVLALMYFK